MKKILILALLGVGLFLITQIQLSWGSQTPAPENNTRSDESVAQESEAQFLKSPIEAPARGIEAVQAKAPSPPKKQPSIPHYDNAPKRIQIQVVDYAGVPVVNFPVNRWKGSGDTPDKDQRFDSREARLTDGKGLVWYEETPIWYCLDPWNPERASDRWNACPDYPTMRSISVPLVRDPGDRAPIKLQLTSRGSLRFELVTELDEEELKFLRLEFKTGSSHRADFRFFHSGDVVMAGYPLGVPYSFRISNRSGFKYLSEEHSGLTLGDSERVHLVHLTERAPTLRVRLLYPDGTPMADQGGLLNALSSNAITDGDGILQVYLYEPIPKTVELLMRDPLHFTATLTIPEIVLPGVNDIGDVYLTEKPCALTGTLLMPDGRPMQFVELFVESVPAGAIRSDSWVAMTGLDGRFQIYKNLPPNHEYKLKLGTTRYYKGKAYVLPEPQPFVVGQRGLKLQTVLELQPAGHRNPGAAKRVGE